MLLLATPLVHAQQNSNVSYALNGVAFGAAIAYCHAKYGPINPNSKGGNCFYRARDSLAQIDLTDRAMKITKQCPNQATLNTCMTPKMSDVAYEILRLFDAQHL